MHKNIRFANTTYIPLPTKEEHEVEDFWMERLRSPKKLSRIS